MDCGKQYLIKRVALDGIHPSETDWFGSFFARCPGGGLVGSLEDYARFVLMLYNGGSWDGYGAEGWEGGSEYPQGDLSIDKDPVLTWKDKTYDSYPTILARPASFGPTSETGLDISK